MYTPSFQWALCRFDVRFGHIFAHGANREEARKALMLSLKNIEATARSPLEGRLAMVHVALGGPPRWFWDPRKKW